MNQYFMFIKKVIKKIVPNVNMQFMCQEMEKKKIGLCQSLNKFLKLDL